MRNCLYLVIASFLSIAAQADYGLINCQSKSKDKSIQLSLDETSDVKVQTSTLSINGKAAKISRVGVTQTEYGILAINVQVGTGPGKYTYAFKNLGSEKCFGVYDSKQKGLAFVDVINSMGRIDQLNCQCNQD